MILVLCMITILVWHLAAKYVLRIKVLNGQDKGLAPAGIEIFSF